LRQANIITQEAVHKYKKSNRRQLVQNNQETFPRRLLAHGQVRPDKPAFREKHLGI
jgi:hypothetical protein